VRASTSSPRAKSWQSGGKKEITRRDKMTIIAMCLLLGLVLYGIYTGDFSDIFDPYAVILYITAVIELVIYFVLMRKKGKEFISENCMEIFVICWLIYLSLVASYKIFL
jgi:hypothetical protein